MATTPIDPDTASLFAGARDLAHRNGYDLAELLNRMQLLLTPRMRQDIINQTLQELLKDMSDWRPAEYLRRISKTEAASPKDMYDAIFGYLEDYVKAKEKQ